MVYNIEYGLSVNPEYTVMRGLPKVNTKKLKDMGYSTVKLSLAYTDKLGKQKQTEFLGIEATFRGLNGIMCNIENICNFRSIKGLSEKQLVIKGGEIVCNGERAILSNPIQLYGNNMQFEKMCFIVYKNGA